MNKISTVNNSSLPSSIKNESTHFPGAEIKAKLSIGPTFPKPGPIFPRHVATAPTEVLKSYPRAENKYGTKCEYHEVNNHKSHDIKRDFRANSCFIKSDR